MASFTLYEPRKTLLEHISVPIQQRRLNSAAEGGEWTKVCRIGSNSESALVGGHALKVASDADKWEAVREIGVKSPLPEVGAHAVQLAAQARRWSILYHIAIKRYSSSVLTFSRELFLTATKEDVDQAMDTHDWDALEGIARYGAEPVSNYAVKAVAATSRSGILLTVAGSRGDSAARRAVDAIAAKGMRGTLEILTVKIWCESDKTREYAKKKLEELKANPIS